MKDHVMSPRRVSVKHGVLVLVYLFLKGFCFRVTVMLGLGQELTIKTS